jgi:SAM-dependent methyltransferase
MISDQARWALALFRRSPLKQAKFDAIVKLLGEVAGKRCLDLGGDNGVISFLLRQRGGDWWSADLGAAQAAAIRDLVGERVWALDGPRLPFEDRSFDAIVVADLLEHIEDDARLVEELARVLEPGGVLIVNVPHRKPRSLVTRLRVAVGLTDAWHGHVRPGYTIAELTRLLRPRFDVEITRTYGRACSELLDVILNAARRWVAEGSSPQSAGSPKGAVVTRQEVETFTRSYRLLSAVYPLLWFASRLDVLLVGQSGYRLIVRARRKDDTAPSVGRAE